MNYSIRNLFGVISIFIAVLAVVACDQRRPQISEDEIAELRAYAPGMTAACLEKARFEGLGAIGEHSVEQCYVMAPARKWRGLWRNDFEGSRFCPEPMKECGYGTTGDDIWLSYSEDLNPPPLWPEVGSGGMYEVEFVGRLTAKRGHYGHAGSSELELVIDQVISIHSLLGPDA